MPYLSFAEGFLLGLGLLIALGPKDTFTIRNSLDGRHAPMLMAIGAAVDALLITLGVIGLGAAFAGGHRLHVTGMMLTSGYLLYFSFHAFRSAYVGFEDGLDELAHETALDSRWQVVKQALSHALLTPYAWFDTVLVVGAFSTIHAGVAKVLFAGGAMAASVVWFGLLTLGAKVTAPLLRSRGTWRKLDGAVGVAMLLLMLRLLAAYPWRTG
ncbi:LysE family transporter [Burkholderia sp. FERM BP-3421]|uniref:LysE/ArgO family amino acid transporter n=1 Tax=Burkholderia sp. FERM BP-3421 TaxID=1494466 RepID=UPI002360CFC0|nr:LysE family transporter [Burkholderia sp. FERM BP-3421]WDD96008.1 LysE family transporter [Burkholderia sp. FERM BP-3421]